MNKNDYFLNYVFDCILLRFMNRWVGFEALGGLMNLECDGNRRTTLMGMWYLCTAQQSFEMLSDVPIIKIYTIEKESWNIWPNPDWLNFDKF